MKINTRFLSLSSAALAALGILAGTASAEGTVVTLGNQKAGNTLELFSNANGVLTHSASVPTGGLGSGAGLGSQGSIAYDEETRLLAAVNAGSNSVSLFRVQGGQPYLINTIPSGGVDPTSVALRGNRLYILNDGDMNNPNNVQGYELVFGGAYAYPSNPVLSGAHIAPAQIAFSPNGRSLVVTEKGTNQIDVFDVDHRGDVLSSAYNPSAGQTPFGFAFDSRGMLFVSEAFGGGANASALSSYKRGADGSLVTISARVKTNETAACWTVVSPDNRFVYTTDAGSGVVSVFGIHNEGSVTLLGNSAAVVGGTSIDAAETENGKSLFVLEAGTHTIATYKVAQNGSLTLGTQASVPAGSAGLAILD